MTKKISLVLAMLGLSAVAYAGAPGDQTVVPSGINLVAPDSVGVWSVGLEAMYVEPISDEFTYGQYVPLNGVSFLSSLNNLALSNKNVSQDWQWGGTIDLTYMFPGNSRDVKLAWTHLFSKTSSNSTAVSGIPNSYFTAPFADAALVTPGVAKGSQKTNYDAVDLVFGQWIKIGDRLDLHPFGGLRWAQVDSTMKGRYYQNGGRVTLVGDPTDIPASSNYGKITSDFDGIGPRAGFDTAVHLGSGFSVVGTFAGSLLVGDIDGKMTNATYNAAGVLTEANNYKYNHDNTRIVPELDARLGLDYMYAFNPGTSMNIQLGYQVVNYFDVIEGDFSSMSASAPNTTASRENWGYQGPYLRLQLNLA